MFTVVASFCDMLFIIMILHACNIVYILFNAIYCKIYCPKLGHGQGVVGLLGKFHSTLHHKFKFGKKQKHSSSCHDCAMVIMFSLIICNNCLGQISSLVARDVVEDAIVCVISLLMKSYNLLYPFGRGVECTIPKTKSRCRDKHILPALL